MEYSVETTEILLESPQPESEGLPWVIDPMSITPSVWIIRNFLSEGDCQALIDLSMDRLFPSTIVDPQTGEHVNIEHRTSWQVFFGPEADPLITRIERDLANIVSVPPEHGEDLQVLRYREVEEYQPHYDFFDTDEPGGRRALAQGGQRYATILMYLNDVESGGETHFPNIDLKIRAAKGDALLFYNMFEDGRPDPDTLHASLPVIEGHKWVATKWFREFPFRTPASEH